MSALAAIDRHRNLPAAVHIALLPFATLVALVALAAFFRLVDLFLFLGAASIDKMMPVAPAFILAVVVFVAAYLSVPVAFYYLGFRDLRTLARDALAAFEFSQDELAALQERVRATRLSHRKIFDDVLAGLRQP